MRKLTGADTAKLTPPEDKSICTLWVGNLNEGVTEVYYFQFDASFLCCI